VWLLKKRAYTPAPDVELALLFGPMHAPTRAFNARRGKRQRPVAISMAALQHDDGATARVPSVRGSTRR
jgi:hypothetical protein